MVTVPLVIMWNNPLKKCYRVKFTIRLTIIEKGGRMSNE